MHKIVLLSTAVLYALPTSAGEIVHQQFDLDAHASVAVSADGCSNSPGPTITLNGELALQGVDADLKFTNNVKGRHTHTEPVEVSVILVPEGDSITFPKPPPLDGVGGNPHIWLQFLDGYGNPVSEEIYVGRCVQGLIDVVDANILLPTDGTAEITTSGDCYNSPGPWITLDGALTLSGIDARLVFRNALRGPHYHDEEVEASVTILPEGESITFAKQPPRGGVGGNPHIWFAFTDVGGYPLDDWAYVGRCVQLN